MEPILKNISFNIHPNSFQFITGPSGAGKTTLLKILMMQLKPQNGQMILFNKDINELNKHEIPNLRRRIGIVFQDFKLLNHLTIYENIALPLIISGKSQHKYNHDIVELLDWVGLKNCRHEYPPMLSGGEQQRAAIARAVINKPELLLADEPTGNLDPELAKRLLTLFIELNKSGTCVLLATHDTNLLAQYPSRLITLENGTVNIHE